VGFFSKDKKSVGVDIGSSGLRVIELEKKDDQMVLSNYVYVKGNYNFVKAGATGVIDDSAGKVLKAAMSKAGIDGRDINVAVPGFSSLITTIELPQMPEKEIGKVIESEASKYIPVKLSEVVYGWDVIDDTTFSPDGKKKEADTSAKQDSKLSDKVRVLMVAIMKEISGKYEKILGASGFKVSSLEIDSFSAARSLVGDKTGCFVVLDIGHKVCNFSIVANKNILINRSVDVAGERITQTIARSLNVDYNRAEQMKIQVAQGQDQGQAAKSGGTEVVKQVFGVISDEVKKTIAIFKNNYPNAEVKGVILTGGTANFGFIAEDIKNKTGLEVITGNPFSMISYPEPISGVVRQKSSFSAVAVGLAMLGFEEGKK
jgi:type IV pilus assembly protein PilM